jgi:predicted site-specific integrase-resolvase
MTDVKKKLRSVVVEKPADGASFRLVSSQALYASMRRYGIARLWLEPQVEAGIVPCVRVSSGDRNFRLFDEELVLRWLQRQATVGFVGDEWSVARMERLRGLPVGDDASRESIVNWIASNLSTPNTGFQPNIDTCPCIRAYVMLLSLETNPRLRERFESRYLDQLTSDRGVRTEVLREPLPSENELVEDVVAEVEPLPEPDAAAELNAVWDSVMKRKSESKKGDGDEATDV